MHSVWPEFIVNDYWDNKMQRVIYGEVIKRLNLTNSYLIPANNYVDEKYRFLLSEESPTETVSNDTFVVPRKAEDAPEGI